MFDKAVIAFVSKVLGRSGLVLSVRSSSSPLFQASFQAEGLAVSSSAGILFKAEHVRGSGTILPPSVSSISISDASLDLALMPKPKAISLGSRGTVDIGPLPLRSVETERLAVSTPIGVVSIERAKVLADEDGYGASLDASGSFSDEAFALRAKLSLRGGLSVLYAEGECCGASLQIEGSIIPTLSLRTRASGLDLTRAARLIPAIASLGRSDTVDASCELSIEGSALAVRDLELTPSPL